MTVVMGPETSPRWRGLLHARAAVVAVVCGIVLCALAATRPGWVPFTACLVYAVTTCALFTTSGLYHRRRWTPRGYVRMQRLDHAMIFVFIAGSYTPFCALLLPRATATWLLTAVWIGAAIGVGRAMLWPRAPRWVSVPLYIALGWLAVVVWPELQQFGGTAALTLLGVGGVTYSLGALAYALRWPNPSPRVFAHHEVFHAATLVGAVCHHVAVYLALYA